MLHPVESWRAGRPIRAVVVDEERLFGHGVTRLLSRRAGIDVVAHARTGDEAVACASSLHPDVVLIDIATPGGVRATRDVKRAVPSAAVLVVTAADMPGAFESAAAAGADGYLTKDAACSEFAVLVEVASLIAALNATKWSGVAAGSPDV